MRSAWQLLAASALIAACASHAETDSSKSQELAQLLVAIKKAPQRSAEKYSLAGKLRPLVVEVICTDKVRVSDDAIDKMIGLLDDPASQLFAAASLAATGPDAQRAIPALERMLTEAEAEEREMEVSPSLSAAAWLRHSLADLKSGRAARCPE